MKKQILFLLMIFSLFPILSKGSESPQGSQFLYLGDFPLSFQNTFFSPFLNPASRQEGERLRLDSAYGTLDGETFAGFGAGIPFSSGYYGFQFFYSDTETGLQSSWGIQAYYSRQLAKDFFFGFSLNAFQLKTNTENATALSLSAGVISKTKMNTLPLTWGVSLVNLGLPASFDQQESTPPIALRLEAQADLDLLGSKYLTRPFISLLSAFYPLGNTFSLGVEQDIQVVCAGAGFSFDANGTNLDSLGGLFFSLAAKHEFDSFALHVRYSLYPTADFNLDGKKEQKHLLSLSLEAGSLDQTGPKIEITQNTLLEKDNQIYLSPNSDGINDYLSFNLQMDDPSGVQEWQFKVTDSEGKTVYEKGVRVENSREKDFRFSSFGQVFKARNEAFYPTEVIWPCVDSQGKTLPDGIYSAQIVSKDFKGNQTVQGNSMNMEKQTLVLDTVPPKLSVEILYKNFSPNGDGVQDFLLIDHKNVSKEGLWNMEIRSGGAPVFRRNWSGKPDETVKWDGKNEDGTPLPDGKYDYVMQVTDRAGNRASYTVNGLVIDTRSPVVKAKNEENYFSPNGDKIKDTVEVEQEFSKEGAWTGEILNSGGEVIRSWQWNGIPPRTLLWDGKNDRGEIEPDGKYLYRVKGKDAAGNQTEQTLTRFVIDTEAPKIRLGSEDPYFSPNQDGKKDLLTFQTDDSSEEDLWIGEISDEKGTLVKTFTWNGAPPKSFTWDGLTHQGKDVPEGSYQFTLKSTDKAGNHTEQTLKGMVLDKTPPELNLKVQDQFFSPAREPGKIAFTLKGSPQGEISFVDQGGNPVFRQKVSSASGTFYWDGRDTQDQPVKDGPYRIIFTSEDAAGNDSSASEEISVLTVTGKLLLKGDRQVINPEKEAYSLIQFSSSVPEAGFVRNFSVTLTNENGETVFEETRSALESPEYHMDFRGKTRAGLLPHGIYYQKLTARYANGETLESNPFFFRVDRQGPELNLSFTPEIFSPDEDGEDDFLKIQLKGNDPSGIARWQIVIQDRFRENFKTFSGKEEIPSAIVWDGKSSAGELTDSAEDYWMTAVAEDRVGNITRTPLVPFSTDILVIKTDRGYKIRISNIEFDLNKATLKPNAKSILDKVAKKLEKYPQYQIRIEGHADRTGTEAWNEKLSLMRSESVKKYLSDAKNLNSARFTTEGMGSRIPLYPNDSEKNRAKNRRVEFLLIR